MLNTPVLFLVFNRPDTTRQVFAKIREIQPKQLFIAADGPRANKEGEHALCEEVRSIVSQVDWDCEVKHLYSEQNLGFSKRIKSALGWFFEHVEMGIILEDDCLPCSSFFRYCELILEKYKHDENIDIVIGSNFCDKPISKTTDYFISDFSYIWGWASWARVLKNINWNTDFSLEEIHEKMRTVYKDEIYVDNLYNIVKEFYKKKDCWDVEFFVHHLMFGKKGILPNENLISNIGNSGTHYNNSENKLLNTKTFEIDFDNFNTNNFVTLSKRELSKTIKQFNEKANPINFRDKLHLLKVKIKNKLNFK